MKIKITDYKSATSVQNLQNRVFYNKFKIQQKKMFRKNYTDTEMKERLNIFWIELEKQYNELNNSEFEFYWEMWGV